MAKLTIKGLERRSYLYPSKQFSDSKASLKVINAPFPSVHIIIIVY